MGKKQTEFDVPPSLMFIEMDRNNKLSLPHTILCYTAQDWMITRRKKAFVFAISKALLTFSKINITVWPKEGAWNRTLNGFSIWFYATLLCLCFLRGVASLVRRLRPLACTPCWYFWYGLVALEPIYSPALPSLATHWCSTRDAFARNRSACW